jgi:siroheme synthase (precorrin-2 oxidase/ferrochelatase)
VDLADDDYQMLRVAAATSGKGVTISSLVRDMIHDYLESIQDEVDIALVAKRKADPRPMVSGSEVRTRLTEAR